jgi:hypothetical protein
VRLNGQQRKILREAILSAYPNQNDLQILLSEQMDVQLGAIAREATYNFKVFSLIQDFEANGKIEQFIRVIMKDRPNSPLLKNVNAELNSLVSRIASIERSAGLRIPHNNFIEETELISPSPPLLFELLLQIDFKEQLRFVRQVISQHQTVGFLVHGESDCGQQLLVNRLFRIKPQWQKHTPININVSSNGLGSKTCKLWGKVGEYFGMSKNTEPHLILERICDRYQTQDVIFIFSSVEYMLFTKTLNPWFQEFWTPLVEMAKHNHPQEKTHLLMFLVDNYGSACQPNMILAEQFKSEEYDPRLPLRLPPVSQFSLESLEDWLDMAIGLSGVQIPAELTAQILLQRTENGIPQLVVEEISKQCALSWEGGLARWLI